MVDNQRELEDMRPPKPKPKEKRLSDSQEDEFQRQAVQRSLDRGRIVKPSGEAGRRGLPIN